MSSNERKSHPVWRFLAWVLFIGELAFVLYLVGGLWAMLVGVPIVCGLWRLLESRATSAPGTPLAPQLGPFVTEPVDRPAQADAVLGRTTRTLADHKRTS